MSKQQEVFTGWWIPREVVRLFQRGDINITELVLLATINSLVDEDKGCYASNEYLAEKLHTHPRYVSRKLRELEELGFVVRSGSTHQRKIETKWTRIAKNKSRQVRTQKVPEPGRVRTQKVPEPLYPLGKGKINNMSRVATRDRVTSEANVLCSRLKSILSSHHKIARWSDSKNTKEIKLLIEKDGIPPSRIKKVLKWYDVHLKDKYTPQAYSAQTFRTKFIQIESAMERSGSKDDSIRKVNVTRRAKRIYRTLGLVWPKVTKDEVLQAIQISLNNHKQFISRARRAIRKWPDEDRKRMLLEQFVKENEVGFDFVQQWMEQMYQKLANWSSWSGKAEMIVFSIDSREAKSQGRTFAADFCGSAKAWDRMVSKLCDK